MKRFWSSTVIIALALVLLAAACGSDDDDTGAGDGAGDVTTDEPSEEEPADEPSEEPADEPSDDAGDSTDAATTLRARFAVDPTTFDPLFVATLADIESAKIIFETLVTPSPDGDIQNVLAETFELAEDGLSIDFKLKEGIQFHDGYGEVTAEDVKFSLERAAGIIPSSEESGAYAFYTALERVDVIDQYSGTIVMSEPSVTLLSQALPLTGILSKTAFEELGEETFSQQPVGTGPYELDEWVPGEHVRFTNFADYSGSAPWVPEQRFEEIVFQIIPEDSAAELAYEAGDVDLLVPVRAASVGRLEGLADTTITTGVTMVYRWVGMNVLDPALSNRDLREAIIAAVDVPSIIAATSEGQDTRATALVAPNAPIGYWADAPVHDQDLEEARRLVELVPEADRALTMTISDDEISRTVAQIVQQNLQDAGLSLEIETLDVASFFVTGESNRERQLFYTEYGINYREPTQELVWFTCGEIDGWNYMYWCDEEYSDLYAQAQTELDDQARHEIYVEMQRIWEEAAHTVWVSHPTTFIAARSDTVQVVADPVGTVFYAASIPQ